MSLRIRQKNERYTIIDCDHIFSLWDILTTLTDTPHLKQFVIEDYDGGNTLVDIECWKNEDISYKEISPGVYLFPYSSIDFIFDDSINSVKVYVLNDYYEGMDYRREAICLISVSQADELSLVLRDSPFINNFIALYLLNKMKVGYNHSMFTQILLLTNSLVKPTTSEIDFVKGTISLGVKKLRFVVKVVEEETSSHYLVNVHKNFEVRPIQEKDIERPGFIIGRKYLKFALPVIVFALLFLFIHFIIKTSLIGNIVLFVVIALFGLIYRYRNKWFKPGLSRWLYYGLMVGIPLLSITILPKLIKVGNSKIFMLFILIFVGYFGLKWLSNIVKKNYYKFIYRNT